MKDPREFLRKKCDVDTLQNILVMLWVAAIVLIGFYLMVNLYDTSRVR